MLTDASFTFKTNRLQVIIPSKMNKWYGFRGFYNLSEIHKNSGVVQLVRAPVCHIGGRGFESRHHCKNEKWVMYWLCCVNNCLLSSATYRYTSTDGDRYSSLCNEVRFLGDSHDVEITTLVIAEYWIVGTLVKAKWILRTPRASSTLASSATQGDAYSYTQVPQF